MINTIHSDGKIWKRRTKNLISGEVECPVCGDLKYYAKLPDKLFKVEYICSLCTKEANKDKPKPKPKPKKKKKAVIGWAVDCPHKPFFKCSAKRECIGCYYNTSKKIALMVKDPTDPKKTAKNNWFYGNKKMAAELLKMLDDIKHGRGLQRGGTRCHFKYKKKKDDWDE